MRKLNMPPFLYKCPTTGFRVQGWTEVEEAEWTNDKYELVDCVACRGSHLINPKMGKTVGESSE